MTDTPTPRESVLAGLTRIENAVNEMANTHLPGASPELAFSLGELAGQVYREIGSLRNLLARRPRR